MWSIEKKPWNSMLVISFTCIYRNYMHRFMVRIFKNCAFNKPLFSPRQHRIEDFLTTSQIISTLVTSGHTWLMRYPEIGLWKFIWVSWPTTQLERRISILVLYRGLDDEAYVQHLRWGYHTDNLLKFLHTRISFVSTVLHWLLFLILHCS